MTVKLHPCKFIIFAGIKESNHGNYPFTFDVQIKDTKPRKRLCGIYFEDIIVIRRISKVFIYLSYFCRKKTNHDCYLPQSIVNCYER